MIILENILDKSVFRDYRYTFFLIKHIKDIYFFKFIF